MVEQGTSSSRACIYLLEDRFLYSGGTDSREKFAAESSASAPVGHKNHPPMGQTMVYTISEVPPVLLGISGQLWLFHGGGPSKKGNGTNRTGGSTILKRIWGGNLLYFPGFGDHQQYETWKFRLCSDESVSGAECTAVAAIRLRMRMRILTRPENSLANFRHQISNKKLRMRRLRNSLANANGFANESANLRSRCGNSLRMEVFTQQCLAEP